METLAALFDELSFWTLELLHPYSWPQLGVILVVAGIARFVDNRIEGFLIGIDGHERGLRELAVRTAQRITFPVTMLVGILMGRATLHAINLPTPLLNVAVPLLLSLAAIRVAVFLLRKSFAPSPAIKAWEGVISTTVWSVVALHFLGWLPAVLEGMDEMALQIGQLRISLLSVTKMLLMVGLFLSIALWIAEAVERRLAKADELTPGMRVGLAKFTRFFLLALALLLGLNAVGIDLTALTIFGGALGVGLGFGLQRIASNFISGFILIFDRSIRPGDVITVGESFGSVKELRARYVVVRNRDGVETLIPNENLITSEVINWSYSDRNVRIRIPIQISYDDDPELAMALMLEAVKASDRVLPEPAPVCRLREFADNGIVLELQVWIDDPEEGVGNVKSALNLAVWKSFKRAGISFPFPQRDIRVKEWPPRGLSKPALEAEIEEQQHGKEEHAA